MGWLICDIKEGKKMKLLKTTVYQNILNCLSIVMMSSTFLYLTLYWTRIPHKIPAHYNAAGIIDRWGDKKEIWFIFIVTILMYIMMSLIEHFPKLWNTGVTLTEENQERIYQLLKSMLVTMKFLLVLIFTFLTINSALARSLPVYFTGLTLGLIFGTMIIYGIRLYMNR